MREQALAKQLKEDKPKALDKIVETYTSYVRTIARNMSGESLTKEDIEEVSIDVFYKLWNNRKKINTDFGLRPFLSAITRNVVRDRFKKLTPLSDDIDGLDIPLTFCLEENAELNEMTACIEEGLKQLSEQEREIFFRYYFYGEKLSVISEAAGITENAAHTKLSRTRNKLKVLLKKRGFDYV